MGLTFMDEPSYGLKVVLEEIKGEILGHSADLEKEIISQVSYRTFIPDKWMGLRFRKHVPPHITI